MKTLKQLLSKTKPDTRNFAKPTDGLDKFVGKHETEVVADANGNDDEVFKGSKVKYADRTKERHGYDKPEDEQVNEEVLSEGDESHKMFHEYHGEIAKDLKGIQKALSDHYDTVTSKKGSYGGTAQWHHVETAKNIHRALADIHQQVRQHVDYNKPMQVKEDAALEEKKLTAAEMKKREEIAQAIERDNPKMPMGKKMAIATSTAKKVAEETTLEEDMIDLYFALDEEDRSTFIAIIENGSDEELLEFVEELGEEING